MKKSIYKASNGTWYIHTKKKRRNITIRGYATKRDAESDYDFAIEKWLKEHNIYLSNNSYKVLVNDYIEYRSKLVRAESLRKDKTQFKYFDEIFSHDTIKGVFEPTRLSIVYNDIFANKTFSTQKKNQLVLTFRDFAKFCFMKNEIEKSTLDNVEITFLPKKIENESKITKRYISISHFNDLFSTISKANDNLFGSAISVLYFGGLRISELLGLLYEDIDLEKRVIYVKRQLLTNGSLTTTLKTNNSYRYVPMNDLLFENLRKNYKSIKNLSRFFPYSHTTFKRKLAEYEKMAKIPKYSAHEFRHSFCSNLALKITNVSEVAYCSKIAGHTPSMFLNTYVKSLDEQMTKKFF